MCRSVAPIPTLEQRMRPYAILSAVVLALSVLAAACSPRESSSGSAGSAGATAPAMPPASAASR
jgi:hypothetical protein